MRNRNRDSSKAVFRPRLGQVALAVVIVCGIGLFGYFSLAGNAAQRGASEDLFGQESDVSALHFAQRDAFGLALSLAEWENGTRTARDVQIARALLGQRLNVVTSTGERTFDVAPVPFQTALSELDQVILSLEDLPVSERAEFVRDSDIAVEEFLTQTRVLSQVFQERSRAVTEDSIQARSRAELELIVTFGFIGAVFLILAAWIAVDIDRGYRRVNREIELQRIKLENARDQLDRTQQVDSLALQITQQISDGIAIDQILSEIGPSFSRILPGVTVEVELEGSQRGAVHVVANSDTSLDSLELNSCVARIREVASIALAREATEQQIDFERGHDSLTGLPNRSVLTEETQSALDDCVRAGGVAAIYLIDIDRFRDFNNSLGNACGDTLLIEVADRLRNFTLGLETAARLSGDEYAVVSRFSTREEAITRAEQLRDLLHFTTLAGAIETDVSVSMGVAISKMHNQSAADLQRSAAMAIYLAKEEDRSGFVIFDEAEHSKLSERFADELAVRNALRNAQFKLHYQPILRLSHGRPVGAEALLRWDRPGVGVLTPDTFLATARSAGILNELGEEVINEALAFWSRSMVSAFDLSQDGLPYISINVDPVQLEDPLFGQFVIGSARRHSVPLAAIVLEVTEHVLSDSQLAVEQLESLRRMGVRIALDDFGTGYSALSQAQHLPLDILKLDRSFIPIDSLEGRDRRLVADILGIADTLGLVTTAEGVESERVAETLSDLGIENAQGFLYSKALPEIEFLRWMQQWQTLVKPSSST